MFNLLTARQNILSHPQLCWKRYKTTIKTIYIECQLKELLQTKEATDGLDVKIIVIGDKMDSDCIDYKNMLNNNGSLLDG